ncbi:occludin/ELL domain-containing protein 1 isoform X1 [Balearica regulorum gibbericeps]|uniref:occludin/ELL domain-containing protein 1 isoform X1 n=1 Tax=Balearica regulorum gibbericeps TaxID=100784 RepID=UPI003F5E557B
MRRAAGLSPEAEKRSSCRMRPRDPHHPQAGGSRWPSPPAPPASQGCRASPARARHVVFEDEVMSRGRPPGRVPPAADGEKVGARSVPPGLAPRPRAVPDYVVQRPGSVSRTLSLVASWRCRKFPAIRSPRQREGYKGVFQDQLAEYTELLGEVRGARRRLGELEAAMGRLPRHAGSRTDLALVEKQQRCEYLKKKLTHIKARIQEYDRDAHDSAVYF